MLRSLNGIGTVESRNLVWDSTVLTWVKETQPGGGAGGSTQVAVSGVVDSSGATVNIADSANNAIKVNVVAGAAGGSTIVSVSVLPNTSSSLPAANSSGANVWLVGGNRLNIGSTAADNAVLSTPMSTGWVKSAGFAVDSSNFVKVTQDPTARFTIGSTAADNAVTATIGTNLQSTVAPSSNSSGLVVRSVVDAILTTASSNAFGTSTSLTIQSSAAAIRSYVTSYSILSTNAGPTKVKFYSGSTLLWPMVFAAVSSAVSGANLAASAPAYLFRTKAAGPLTLQIGSGASSVAGWQVAVSYFRAP